jgi:hypothetical protein
MTRGKIEEMLETITGGVTQGRVEALERLCTTLKPDELAKLRVEECSDERTGQRYGLADCRAGRAIKIGGGGRNKGSRYAYQIWAVWN